MEIGKRDVKDGKVIGTAIVALIVVASLFATISPAFGRQVDVPSGEQGIFYLDPDDSSVPSYCNTTQVEIWLNTSTSFQKLEFDINYTCCCGNVTADIAWDPEWEDVGATWWQCGHLYGFAANEVGASNPTNLPAGNYHVGDFTLHCCNDSDLGYWDDELGCCATNLDFVRRKISFWTGMGYTHNDPIAAENGTFMCGNPVEVNKTVWSKPKGDPDYSNGTWVNEITDAQVGELYRFNCTIHSKCCELTDIDVVDTLSSSLEYADNVTVNGIPDVEDWLTGNQFGWNSLGPLTPCNTIPIEFDARVITNGYDCNIQNVTAICAETGVMVSDEDTACINAPIPGPDLVVTKVGPDYIFAGLTNVFEAELNNTGGSSTNGTFNVSIEITAESSTLLNSSKITGVGPLDAGQKAEYLWLLDWKPDNYENITVNVTVDCDNDIAEGNEGNNYNVKNKNYTGDCVSDKMSPATCYGYRGQHPLQLLPGTTINGGMVYTLGDYKYLSAYYNPGWTSYTVNFTLPGDNDEITDTTADIPTGATIKMARLYVDYNWANNEEPNPYFSMEVNGTSAPEIASYSDRKNFSGYYNKYYGKKVYNVTDIVTGNGDYQAVLSNSWPGSVSIDGMGLLVVYEKADEPLIEYYIAEGYDLLKTRYKYQHHVLPEDATTNATFPGITDIMALKLFTVAPGACSAGTKNRLYFNDMYWDGVWGPCSTSTNPMATDQRYVPMANVSASSNVVKFQDNDDGFGANLAILIGEKSPLIYVEPQDTFVQPQDQFDVDIVIDPYGIPLYGVEYKLVYNTSVVRAETQNKGPFLGSYGETMVVINDINQANGVVSYAETRTAPGGVTAKGTVATIHFVAIGARGSTSMLDLFDVIIVDENGDEVTHQSADGTVEISDNIPPVSNGTSKHEFNNVAKKYPCETLICSCSWDPDYPGKGGNITYVQWAYGEGQYGTSEGPHLNNCTCIVHKYETWLWAPFGDSSGNYVQFNVNLTVTDDGCPEETNTTFFPVNVFIAGDGNGDGSVNILDAVGVGRNWGHECGCIDPCACAVGCYSYLWDDPLEDRADMNNDCDINILDAVIIGANWGHTAWE